MRKILVTEGAGFIKFHLSKKLLANGKTLIGLDNLNDYSNVRLKQAWIEQLFNHKKIRLFQLDLANLSKVDESFVNSKPELFVYLAAQVTVLFKGCFMNKSNLKISVLMSVYNGSLYLRESIESILNQTFSDFEFIIIDDCSTDNSWEIITEYAGKDRRIILMKNNENIGLTKSLNKGLKIAKGEYIARQDADDISLPERFEKQVLLLDKDPDVALVSCEIEYIDPEGNFIGKDLSACDPDSVDWYLLFFNRLSGHSQVLFRRKLISNLGDYCESYRYSQDYELWCRIVKVGKIFILPEILLQQRRHNQSISLEKSAEQEAYAVNQVKQNISQLIDKEISLEEAKYLKAFWMEYGRTHTIKVRIKGRIIHNIMKEIVPAFIEQKMSDGISKGDMSRQLRTLTGKKFIAWMKTLSTKHEVTGKISVFFYTLRWYPLGLLKYYISSVKHFLLRVLGKLKIRAIIKANTENKYI